MKNVFIYAMVLAIAFLPSCSKMELSEDSDSKLNVVFSVAEKNGWENTTRAVKSGWEEGDEILIVLERDGDLYKSLRSGSTIKLIYNGSDWVANDVDVPTLGLQSGGGYWAYHHPGTILVGESNNIWAHLSGYKGGEQLRSVGTYTINGGVIDLGTISLERDSRDLQISVKELVGEHWSLSIFEDRDGGNDNINFIHHNAGNLYVTDNGRFGGYGPSSGATGLKYGGDFLFYFTKLKMDATTLVFKLVNDTDVYYYTKTGVTNEMLQGGKAYILPAITDSAWEKSE